MKLTPGGENRITWASLKLAVVSDILLSQSFLHNPQSTLNSAFATVFCYFE